MKREFYSDSITNFLSSPIEEIIGNLTMGNDFSLELTQKTAWIEEIRILKNALSHHQGTLYFEYSIPRIGKRIDALVIIGPVIFILEYKVGETEFYSNAIEQVWDYALDLKNFHETSHNNYIAPILIATNAKNNTPLISFSPHNDKVFIPIKCNDKSLYDTINKVLSCAKGEIINSKLWEQGRYCPTPTIIEASTALYNGHSVEEISRSDAGAINLTKSSETIDEIIKISKQKSQKSICFLTGVPGAGKTLVGLNIATKHFDKANDLYSVFLSGNGPLVKILREALARDKVKRGKETGIKIKKGEAMSEVKMFIQNVHNFRDDCLVSQETPPIEHVALFDEAQRAWNLEQTSFFMKSKKNKHNFHQSEPEFLISCLDRHSDWAVIVCLVGGGQEINTGEAGITEWLDALNRSFPHWQIYISPRLTDDEYGAREFLESHFFHSKIHYIEELHLSVSMRSFRAENVSLLIKQILDLEKLSAQKTLKELNSKYPIVLTRDINKAKQWLKEQARGSERYGMVVSSQAQRLKPYAIDVKSPMDYIHWFLDGKEDVRSSYYLEDVATEFHIQGLELDWVCVVWDADFRFDINNWEYRQFCGNKWNYIRKAERKKYLKNAYRVLLTRARQGIIIAVPEGDIEDPTRKPEFYDPTFKYLKEIGFTII